MFGSGFIEEIGMGMGAGVETLMHTRAGHLDQSRSGFTRADRRSPDTSVNGSDPWWAAGGQDEIDAVALAQPCGTRMPIPVGAVKWVMSVNAGRITNRWFAEARNPTGEPGP